MSMNGPYPAVQTPFNRRRPMSAHSQSRGIPMHLTVKLTLLAGGLALLASPTFALSAVTTTPAGFSAGPGTDYGPARQLVAGTRVDVIWCGTHANWCLVDLHNKRGWLPYADLKFPKTAAILSDGGTPGGGGGAADDQGGGGSSGTPASRSVMNTNPPHQPITITRPLHF